APRAGRVLAIRVAATRIVPRGETVKHRMLTTRRAAAVTGAAALAVVLAGCGGSGSGDGRSGEAPEALVLGLLPSQEVDQLVLDAEELGDLLSDELGIPVTAEVTTDYAALVTAMQSGQAQIGMFGPIALVQAADQAGAVPILQSVRF